MRMTIFLILLLVVAPNQESKQISDEQRRQFIDVLGTLPSKGEFYTDEAVAKAVIYLPVLFALTERDLRDYDVYPFLAISRGSFELRESREYSVRHFGKISHPELKLFWGALLFDSGEANFEIHGFLRSALASEQQSKVLSEMMGPNFESFKKRVLLK